MTEALKKLSLIKKKEFQSTLISWFQREKRDLPWRKETDPYKIWVSEIMLQQTKVDTVVPYFHRFIEQFPTINALAQAEEEKVLKAWEGLGYYSRVRNLHSAVREVQEKYGGKVPDSLEELRTLKGIGPYTAGAILSIAYGIPAPAVDGNVMRVLSRILLIREDISKSSSRKIFEEAVRELISEEDPSSFNQGLMELGALICTPTSPSCLLCPVQTFCRAFREGVEHELPVKSKGKKQRKVDLLAAIIEDENGRAMICKRPEKGLLANLWEFPNTEISLPHLNKKKQLEHFFKERFQIEAKIVKKVGQMDHVFSHLIWNIEVYKGKIYSPVKETDEWKLVTRKEIQQFPFPVSHQKISQLYFCNESHS